MLNYQNISTEKFLYIAWVCFHNVTINLKFSDIATEICQQFEGITTYKCIVVAGVEMFFSHLSLLATNTSMELMYETLSFSDSVIYGLQDWINIITIMPIGSFLAHQIEKPYVLLRVKISFLARLHFTPCEKFFAHIPLLKRSIYLLIFSVFTDK